MLMHNIYYCVPGVMISRSGRACARHASADTKTTAWAEYSVHNKDLCYTSWGLSTTTWWQPNHIPNLLP